MKILRLLFCLFFLNFSFGQVEFHVISAENGEPVPYARVEITGLKTNRFIVSDDRGIFLLTVDSVAQIADFTFKISAYGYALFEGKLLPSNQPKCPLMPLVKSVDEVVVTGQLTANTVENAVQRIKVIDRQMIDSKGAVNLRDVLQNELNIRISQDQVLGSGMTLQGLSGENVKILIDGVPVIGRMNGEIDLSQINLANVERIEIVEGPLSVAYGSNALAGTINLISKKTVKNGYEMQLNSYYETVGNYNLDSRLTLNHKKHKISIFGGRNFFDGWSKSDPSIEFPKEKIADSGRYQTWKPKEQFNLGIHYSWVIKRTTISPYAEFFNETIVNRGLPRPPFYISAFDDFYATSRNNVGFQFNSLFKTKYKMQGVASYNRFQRIKNTYLKDLTDLSQQLTANSSDQDTSLFQAWMSRATFSKSRMEEKLNYEIGYDVNHERATGKRMDTVSRSMTDLAFFSTVDWNINSKMVLKPALRFATNSVYGNVITPALNFKWNRSKSTWRASYASGYRSPTMKELYMNFVDINHNILGNAALLPEKSNHFQGWFATKFEKRKQLIDWEFSAFYQQVRNKIALSTDQSGINYSYFNINRFESSGFRLQVGLKNKHIHWKTGVAYTGIKTNYGTDRFVFSPEVNTSITWTWIKTGVSFFAYCKYTGKFISYSKDDTGALNQFAMSDYTMLDINCSRDFFKQKLSLSVGAKNLLNVTSINTTGNASSGAHASGSGSTPIGWGRSGYVKIQFKFGSIK